jgi:hypothetical protein
MISTNKSGAKRGIRPTFDTVRPRHPTDKPSQLLIPIGGVFRGRLVSAHYIRRGSRMGLSAT